MAAKHTRLELTWIGKDERPRLEPRILLEDPEISYFPRPVDGGSAHFENKLIYGDNLLALKALEKDYESRVKCIFIDPPYNTGSAFQQYDDGVEHSMWLSLMRDRLEILRRLLAHDGSLWLTIDDNEAHYLKVLLDEVFGRSCFVASIVWRSTDNSNNDAKQFSVDHNYILVYGKAPGWQPKKLADQSKRTHFSNPDNDPRGPWFDGNPLNSPKPRPNLMYSIKSPQGHTIQPPSNGWRWSRETLAEKLATGEIRFTTDGRRIRRRTYLADMKGLPPSTVWADIEETGHNRQAKYELKNLFSEKEASDLFATPKPERLIAKILELSTDTGDLVLDSFAGSGTTGAVAHKMNRQWIMIELGKHCFTDLIPRIKKVISGADNGGISELYSWSGGGGFRFYRIAPSLLEIDKWGNWVVSKQYNPEMLAEAMCKLEGFRYAPNPDVFWIHGQSTETDLIYVTTQNLSQEQLQFISDQVGDERTLLICCSAFRAKPDDFANLTLKKIPQAVLHRCEWGRDDYSLNVNALPDREPEPDQNNEESAESMASAEETSEAVTPRPATRRGRPRRRRSTMQELPLFASLDQGGDA
jgi:adenine-specific DNA-methyltransferase